jgi:hypothetical protein
MYVDFSLGFCVYLQPDPAGGTARKTDPMTSNFQAEQAIRDWTNLSQAAQMDDLQCFVRGFHTKRSEST